jgi:surface protein
MTLLKRLGLILPVSLFAATLLIAGCSKSGTSAGLEKEDTDGDGIADIYDSDMDGDGIPNGSDPDIDGDGIPNGKDPSPGTSTPDYCDSIEVFRLNDEQTTGSEIELTWNLLSSKTGGFCVVKDDVKAKLVRVRASATGAKSTASEQTNPVINTRAKIEIPHTCVQGATVEVTYDFGEIAKLIKADPNAPGWTVKQSHTADPKECKFDVDGAPPGFGPPCPSFTNDNIKAAVNDYIAGGGNGKYIDGSEYARCGLIGTWDVSGVTNMNSLFKGTDFNEDISEWDVSNVTTMQGMFQEAYAFNQPLDWGGKVAKVRYMNLMFSGATAFNQPLNNWDVSGVYSMGYMFWKATAFNQPLDKWGDKLLEAGDMYRMFSSATAFNQPIGNWKASNVTTMERMFDGASSFNQPLGEWDVRRVQNMIEMFQNASDFDQNISGWCVSHITGAPRGFDNGAGFEDQTAKQPQWGTCPD